MISTTAPAVQWQAITAVVITPSAPLSTRATDSEAALVSCLILHPAYLDSIGQLQSSDFAELAHGTAYDAIRYAFDHTGDVDPAILRDEIAHHHGRDIHPAGIIADWMTDWVPHWHYRYYANQVAQSSIARALEQDAIDTLADIRIGINGVELRHRRADREKKITEMESRLDGLL